MTQPLGDRVRARREVLRGLANRAREEAKQHADQLRDQLQTYVDKQTATTLAAAKSYVDKRINELRNDVIALLNDSAP